jgi:hypothetical protein
MWMKNNGIHQDIQVQLTESTQIVQFTYNSQLYFFVSNLRAIILQTESLSDAVVCCTYRSNFVSHF